MIILVTAGPYHATSALTSLSLVQIFSSVPWSLIPSSDVRLKFSQRSQFQILLECTDLYIGRQVTKFRRNLVPQFQGKRENCTNTAREPMSFMFIGDDKTHFSWRLEAACPSEELVPIYESKRATSLEKVAFTLRPRVISPTLNATSAGPFRISYRRRHNEHIRRQYEIK